jgi:hypothetical protein
MLDGLSVDQVRRWMAFFQIQAKESEEAEMRRTLEASTQDGTSRAKGWVR